MCLKCEAVKLIGERFMEGDMQTVSELMAELAESVMKEVENDEHDNVGTVSMSSSIDAAICAVCGCIVPGIPTAMKTHEEWHKTRNETPQFPARSIAEFLNDLMVEDENDD